MIIDNATLTWALLLVAFGLLGVMISFIYMASVKTKSSKKKRLSK